MEGGRFEETSDGLSSEGIPPDPLISEVGSNQPREKVENDNLWKTILEQQNKNLLALLQAVKNPSVSTHSITLPEFNPDIANTDARAWISTASMCVADYTMQGPQLMIALSRALKGQASVWLSQISYQGMTWGAFKELFIARFDGAETNAAFLINLNSSKPKDNECLSAYAARIMTSLMSRWHNLSTEQIAVATVISHVAQFEPRIQRLAFTNNIVSRTEMLREMKAMSYLKRRVNTSFDKSEEPEPKRHKPTPINQPIKCYQCGKLGHRALACRQRNNARNDMKPSGSAAASTTMKGNSKPLSTLTCFKCGKVGHISPRCPTINNKEGATSIGGSTSERRVDLCVVGTPSGTLLHSGASLEVE